MASHGEVWKGRDLAVAYLEGVRGAIPLAAEQIDVMMRLIAAADVPVRRFLDLGCGDGVLGGCICRAYPDSSGVLLDLSEPMISAARDRLADFSERLRFVVGDYSDSGWLGLVRDQEPFDVIVSGFSIHHQPDSRKEELYREIFGLLSPGGVFINIEHVASATEWGSRLFDEVFVDSLFAFHSARPDFSETRQEVNERYYNRPDKGSNILTPVDVQCDWLREIGFADVDCYFKYLELTVFGGRKP